MKKKRICVIDYDLGNVKSMLMGLRKAGADPVLSRDEKEILSSDAVVLPGVGAFNVGIENLKKYSLVDIIYRFIKTGKSFLGVCLGMQMLMDEGEEFGWTKGLGLLKGKVIKLSLKDGHKERIPHVGWNMIDEPKGDRWKGTIFNGLKDKSVVYFVHSFRAQPADPADILSTTFYGGNHFCSAVHKDNVYGCQFHPEKSAAVGLQILNNFVALTK